LTSTPIQPRALILGRWTDRILSTYPAESARFLGGERDRFANPVGTIIREEAGALVDAVLTGFDPEAIRGPLDRVVRIRAVQEFTPAEALGFLFELKPVVREVIEEADGSGLGAGDLAEIESRVDRLVLLAMDIFVECRERIYEIRVNEIRNSSFKTLERMQEWRVAKAREIPPDDAETRPGE